MSQCTWRPRLHLTPERGWINDPNGLCQLGGTYHFYYQFGSGWPQDETKWWGHATSTDLLTWDHREPAIAPTIPEDRDGIWSGCSVATGGEDGLGQRAYYTGHVVPEGAVPHSAWSQESYQVMVEGVGDGELGGKRVLLGPSDYPPEVCAHVRDPKVWREADGTWWMLLGTRLVRDETKEKDVGAVMLWRSPDGETWAFDHFVTPTERLGYMWECPNLVRLEGADYLAVCPQGMPHEELRWQNLWEAGYFALPGRVQDTREVDASAFVEWDHGFDFYAPQAFVDETGRTILVGWMGTFDSAYSSAPEGLAWCHCLTLPRELAVGEGGRLLQRPVRELDGRRTKAAELLPGRPLELDGMVADIVLEDVRGTGSLTLGDGERSDLLALSFDGSRLSLAFAGDAPDVALGRTHRTIACDGLRDLRVVVDGSTVEAYANNGAEVFSTRWFPRGEKLVVRLDFAAQGTAYAL